MMSKLSKWMLVAAAVAVVMVLSSAAADAAIFAKARTEAAAASANLGGDGSCCAPAPCCPNYCIKYCNHGRRCCSSCCEPPIKTALTVKDPCCCGCAVEIPVCLPACCTGCPTMCSRCGLFGRGIVTYDGCCGVTVKVIFTKCGDVIVHTYGA